MGTHPIFESDFDCLTDKMDDAFVKKRLEKDLEDLKKMIALHFEQRKKDEEELEELKSRIDKRKQMREEQMRLRAEREKERQEYERAEKERKAAEEAARKAEEEQKKKDAMAALSASFGGYKSQAQKRTGKGDREKKKKVLAERRKPLNIDHLDADKVRAKIDEMYKYLCEIESERIEAEHAYEPARHEVTVMRNRVNMTMQ